MVDPTPTVRLTVAVNGCRLMSANPIRSMRVPGEPPPRHVPQLPTVVFGSYKGGVWKTCLSVAVAERLAMAGLRVLFVTTDRQEDARFRLGISPDSPQIARRDYGPGQVTVLGARQSQAIELLYRQGPVRLGIGPHDIAIVDTPPEEHGGHLPGVLLVAITDGTDAARNLLTMLQGTPDNTDIMLVRVWRAPKEVWARDAHTIESVARRQMDFLEDPLPKSDAIKDAHDSGESIWSLRRTRVARKVCRIRAADCRDGRVGAREPDATLRVDFRLAVGFSRVGRRRHA